MYICIRTQISRVTRRMLNTRNAIGPLHLEMYEGFQATRIRLMRYYFEYFALINSKYYSEFSIQRLSFIRSFNRGITHFFFFIKSLIDIVLYFEKINFNARDQKFSELILYLFKGKMYRDFFLWSVSIFQKFIATCRSRYHLLGVVFLN